MIAICKPVLAICFFLTAPLCAMDVDTDVYYLRFGESFEDKEGMLTTFPKSALNDMQLLKGAQEDLGADVGTEEKPFFLDLHALSPDDFDKVITLIEQVRGFIAVNPQQNNNASAIQEFLWSSRMGGILNIPDRYTRLATLLSCGNYLGIDPVIIEALKLCIAKLPREKSVTLSEDLGGGLWGFETLDRALKAGLKNINKLPNDLLIPIKEALSQRIFLHIEKKIVDEMNDPKTKHQKTILEVPQNLKDIRYAKILSKSQIPCRIGGRVGFLVFDPTKVTSDTIPFKEFARFKVSIPQIPSLSGFPNLDLINDRLRGNNPNLNIPIAYSNARVFFSEKRPFTLISFYSMPGPVEIGCSHIFNGVTQKWISIPNQISWFAPFKDNAGQEKLVCIVGTEDDNPKIVIIDPISEECKLIKTFPNTIFNGVVVFGSKLICHLYEKTTNDPYLDIMDLDNYATLMHMNIRVPEKIEYTLSITKEEQAEPYNEVIWYYDVFKNLCVRFMRGFQEAGINNVYAYTYIIDTKTFQAGENKYFVSTEQPMIVRLLPELYSRMLVIKKEHPDLVNLRWVSSFDFNGDIYVGGFDADGTKNFFIYKYFSKEMLAIFDQIKGLTDLSIEQLYMLEEIIYRLTNNSFTGMTPTEKQIFELMDLKTQNLFLNLFSKDKPITEMVGRQFIVNPKKVGEYQEPLKKYIATQSGQKRRAEEAPTEERPAKKLRANEDESEDETTLDESEEDKE
jgi:hypothetical protein